MSIVRAYQAINSWLEGLPSAALSIILMGFGVFAFYVALRGSPIFKAAVIAWFLFP